jgi:D-ribose pyranose/furanose isomerase RbsD
MNIRPIDMQVLIPRTVDVSKVQQLANQQVIVNQQLLGEQLKQFNDHRQHQVQQLLQSEGEKVTANKEREAQQQHQKKPAVPLQQRDSDRLEQEAILNRPSQDDPLRGHSIDIIT